MARGDTNKKTLVEKLSCVTCLMQLKNVACNYFATAHVACNFKIVACAFFSCIRQVAKDNFSFSERKKIHK